MKLFKKNQVIIYVIVLMLMTAGYLNYTTNAEKQASVETAIQMEASDDMQLAGIGDATLVNSNDVVDEDTSNTNDVDNKTNEVNTNQIAEFSNDTTNINEENVNQNNTTQTSTNSSNDYFVKSKLERDTMYSQMIETYEKVLNSTNSLETQRQSASQEIQKINEVKNSIMICENLISTKGFENNVVFVNGSSVSVIIGTSSEMKAEEVAQVQNIIAREMKAEIENIHIATK
ncbi:MAG: SpoIIIAH-like family protein [Clostridia bacterium]|nr:SpoIIIAH-like family protein [Clostridia bacterium]